MQTIESPPNDLRIPSLKPSVRLAPFAEARSLRPRYLVEVGENYYVVAPLVHRILRALQDGATTVPEVAAAAATPDAPLSHGLVREAIERRIPRECFAGEPARAAHSPFAFQRSLIPERAAMRISARLAFLFAPPIVVAVIAANLVLAAALVPRGLGAIGALSLPTVLWLYPLLIASTILHEFGHAAACRRFRCPHGAIGFAIYLFYPSFYTDLGKAWRLPPRRRVVVDLGGIYFQSIAAVPIGIAAVATHSAGLTVYVLATLYSIAHTLNPFFKMDGYWLLSDAGGLTNLHVRMGETIVHLARRVLGRPAAALDATAAQFRVLCVYAALAALYVGFVAYFVVGFAAHTFDHLFERQAAAAAALAAAHTVGAWSLAGWNEVVTLGLPAAFALLVGLSLVRLVRAATPFLREIAA